jgi:hypothetical protein
MVAEQKKKRLSLAGAAKNPTLFHSGQGPSNRIITERVNK